MEGEKQKLKDLASRKKDILQGTHIEEPTADVKQAQDNAKLEPKRVANKKAETDEEKKVEAKQKELGEAEGKDDAVVTEENIEKRKQEYGQQIKESKPTAPADPLAATTEGEIRTVNMNP